MLGGGGYCTAPEFPPPPPHPPSQFLLKMLHEWELQIYVDNWQIRNLFLSFTLWHTGGWGLLYTAPKPSPPPPPPSQFLLRMLHEWGPPKQSVWKIGRQIHFLSFSLLHTGGGGLLCPRPPPPPPPKKNNNNNNLSPIISLYSGLNLAQMSWIHSRKGC